MGPGRERVPAGSGRGYGFASVGGGSAAECELRFLGGEGERGHNMGGSDTSSRYPRGFGVRDDSPDADPRRHGHGRPPGHGDADGRKLREWSDRDGDDQQPHILRRRELLDRVCVRQGERGCELVAGTCSGRDGHHCRGRRIRSRPGRSRMGCGRQRGPDCCGWMAADIVLHGDGDAADGLFGRLCLFDGERRHVGRRRHDYPAG